MLQQQISLDLRTLTSHILHNIHNQGIFIEFPVLLLQLLACKTL